MTHNENEHCLCDTCYSDDCKETEPPLDKIKILIAWRKWRYFNRGYPGTAERLWSEETALINKIEKTPHLAIEHGVTEGWWPK